jgi:predicted nucleotidyltransferase
MEAGKGIRGGSGWVKPCRDWSFEQMIHDAIAVLLTRWQTKRPLCGIVKTRWLAYFPSKMTRESAIASAREVASYLKQVHGATRVLLFGSSVQGEFLPHHSDIDLYFEGIPYDLEFAIAGKTFCRFAELDLDIIPAGHASDGLKKEVFQTGVLL